MAAGAVDIERMDGAFSATWGTVESLCGFRMGFRAVSMGSPCVLPVNCTRRGVGHCPARRRPDPVETAGHDDRFMTLP
ncbi:hypothetical protein GCM10010326_11080 [Streptomyces xanthochromogenes]|uniref:Uncharacterized protein n=1 Tax=Streptomyces xanthochromogenes TaxID=67384 RepID=A0ABQ2ZMA7_9ACTN|nr:hypothetical protein GCM10010326_11080 [Streptomyces xanthochromogenes]